MPEPKRGDFIEIASYDDDSQVKQTGTVDDYRDGLLTMSAIPAPGSITFNTRSLGFLWWKTRGWLLGIAATVGAPPR